MFRKKDMKKLSLQDVPVETIPLLVAFHAVFRLQNAVVRCTVGGSNPMAIMQILGRATGGQLRCLEHACQCRVEVEAQAPNTLLILMFGYEGPSSIQQVMYVPPHEKEMLRFWYKEL